MVAPSFHSVPSSGLSSLKAWKAASLIMIVLLLGPILAVFAAATGDSEGLWAHLFETVLPDYVLNTLILMGGVAVVSLVFGVSSAWVVVRYDFPARGLFEWMLLLPAAVPAYLIAYTYTDFLEYAGPVQSALRDLFGWRGARDYWFPEVRSMGSAALVMGSVLYPYVYVMARSAFVLTPASLFESAMLAKRSLFWTVALPLARPAIAAGLALAMMETVSDFGTVEYFAIPTLTLGIFNVWLGMNSLAAAAQIASVAFLFILALLAIERIARRHRRFMDTTRRATTLQPKPLTGHRALAGFMTCAIPILIGFVLPVGVLLNFVLRGYSLELTDAVLAAALNTFGLALAVAVLVMGVAVLLVLTSTFEASATMRRVTVVASIGYAFPGTILAIGVVTFVGAVDGVTEWIGLSEQGWLSGTVALVVIACMVRFQAVGHGAVSSGLERMPPNMVGASRVLGRDFGQTIRTVVLPMIRTSLIAGGLLVFVDVMKELPMTLLLRPFNFETLATYVYQFAKDELLEEAALPALVIVATGVIPVIVMNAALRRVTRF